MRPAFGDWRSLVAHFVRDEGVGGSNPLSPTKFEKPAQRAGFLHLQLMRMRTSGGGEVRLERSERTLRQQRPAGRATKVASNPLSPTKIRKACSASRLLHLKPMRMRTSGGLGGSTRRRYCYGLQVFFLVRFPGLQACQTQRRQALFFSSLPRFLRRYRIMP